MCHHSAVLAHKNIWYRRLNTVAAQILSGRKIACLTTGTSLFLESISCWTEESRSRLNSCRQLKSVASTCSATGDSQWSTKSQDSMTYRVLRRLFQAKIGANVTSGRDFPAGRVSSPCMRDARLTRESCPRWLRTISWTRLSRTDPSTLLERARSMSSRRR